MTQRMEEELRLLIVDDEEAARYGMRRALSGFGYSIDEAESVEAARALLQKQQTDLLASRCAVRS